MLIWGGGRGNVTCMCRAVFEALDHSNLLVCGDLTWQYWLAKLNLRYLSCFRMDTGFKSPLVYAVRGKNVIFYNSKKRKRNEGFFFICYPIKKG